MLVRVPHGTLGHTIQAGVVPKLSRTPGHIRHSGPDLGADTQAVLQELGMSPEDIQALQAQQLIKTRP
jgi:crotonobetainyl-CoA:carnitine CoA-transferase CaiB-like acyl-CoA transferase